MASLAPACTGFKMRDTDRGDWEDRKMYVFIPFFFGCFRSPVTVCVPPPGPRFLPGALSLHLFPVTIPVRVAVRPCPCRHWGITPFLAGLLISTRAIVNSSFVKSFLIPPTCRPCSAWNGRMHRDAVFLREGWWCFDSG